MAETKRAATERVQRARRKAAPVPEECSQFVRRRIAEALPAICESLLEKAKQGDATALKTLWQMAAPGRTAEESAESGAGSADTRGAAFARAALKQFGGGSELV